MYKVHKFLRDIIKRDDLCTVQSVIDKGININMQDNIGRTMLMYAVSEGRLNIVKCLLDNGADINVQNIYGSTALAYVIGQDRLDIAKYLTDCGADVTIQDENGRTVLMYAAKHKDCNTVQYLIELQGHNVETYLAYPDQKVRNIVKKIMACPKRM